MSDQQSLFGKEKERIFRAAKERAAAATALDQVRFSCSLQGNRGKVKINRRIIIPEVSATLAGRIAAQLQLAFQEVAMETMRACDPDTMAEYGNVASDDTRHTHVPMTVSPPGSYPSSEGSFEIPTLE